MQGRIGVEVAFTDGAGRHWVRRAPTGSLEPLESERQSAVSPQQN
jgi:hypothetical protein